MGFISVEEETTLKRRDVWLFLFSPTLRLNKMHTRARLSAFYYGENTKPMSTLTDAVEQLNSLKQIVLHL